MAGVFVETLRQLFPSATLQGGADFARAELGAVVDVDFDLKEGVIVVTLARGSVVRFYPDPSTWSVVDRHLRTGDLSFEDPVAGLRRLAEILGTLRNHLDS